MNIPMSRVILPIMMAIATVAYGQTKNVCFTVDDLPVVSYGMKGADFQTALTQKLVDTFKNRRIPAIGFVNEQKLRNNGELDQTQVSLLKIWLDAGMELGNHTFSHPDYHKTSYSDFTADIIKGEATIKQLLSERGKTIRYFRHPYLHRGNNKEKADSLDAFLKENGYIAAPVTIDNDDYLFAVAYSRAKAKDDSTAMVRIGQDYIDYMERKLHYFEQQSQRLFGRHINQILLMHASLLNADYVDSLAAMFIKNNYQFVGMDQALEDEVYQSPITAYSGKGLSWLDLWALSRGMKNDFFKDDPPTPDYIVELSK